MENLQDFMLLFRMQPDSQQPTAEQLTTMQQQWSAYIGDIAVQAKLISISRLGFEGTIINSNLVVTTGISITSHETLTGNMVIKATSLQEATEIAKSCPVLTMGGSVEVRNTIPMQS